VFTTCAKPTPAPTPGQPSWCKMPSDIYHKCLGDGGCCNAGSKCTLFATCTPPVTVAPTPMAAALTTAAPAAPLAQVVLAASAPKLDSMTLGSECRLTADLDEACVFRGGCCVGFHCIADGNCTAALQTTKPPAVATTGGNFAIARVGIPHRTHVGPRAVHATPQEDAKVAPVVNLPSVPMGCQLNLPEYIKCLRYNGCCEGAICKMFKVCATLTPTTAPTPAPTKYAPYTLSQETMMIQGYYGHIAHGGGAPNPDFAGMLYMLLQNQRGAPSRAQVDHWVADKSSSPKAEAVMTLPPTPKPVAPISTQSPIPRANTTTTPTQSTTTPTQSPIARAPTPPPTVSPWKIAPTPQPTDEGSSIVTANSLPSAMESPLLTPNKGTPDHLHDVEKPVALFRLDSPGSSPNFDQAPNDPFIDRTPPPTQHPPARGPPASTATVPAVFADEPVSAPDSFQCSPGRFIKSGFSYCFSCNHGQFQDTYDATSCKDCKRGTFSGFEYEGQPKCSSCPAGRSSPVGSTTCPLFVTTVAAASASVINSPAPSTAPTVAPTEPRTYVHGLCGNSKQETGYMKLTKADIFYWFVESSHTPATDPIILWLSGGPGKTANKAAHNSLTLPIMQVVQVR
jgi:hypothetical protein